MGITRGLVRIVFTKTRSAGAPDSNAKSNVMDKKRWNSVRSYLCGDEYNSVLAEEDSASVRSSGVTVTQFSSSLEQEDSSSVRSSEATVTQPIPEDLAAKKRIHGEEGEPKEDIQAQMHENTFSKIMREEQAAIIIQSAFRGFLARCRSEGINRPKDVEEETIYGMESPNRESLGTSIEVQTGNSVENFSSQEERMAVLNRTYKKDRTQVMKLKEDWDDSTVSSNISKMRIQNRLEASTRRERALAYAFSQQLRICSKKRQAKSDGTEPDMGWSWLERWMATRLPESSSAESHINMRMEPSKCNQRFKISKKLLDVAVEEKESCGSNEVSLSFDSFSVGTAEEKDGLKPSSYRLKPTRTVSRRKTVPSCQYAGNHTKVSKNDYHSREAEKEKKHKAKSKQLESNANANVLHPKD